jgi:hypothetical protein
MGHYRSYFAQNSISTGQVGVLDDCSDAFGWVCDRRIVFIVRNFSRAPTGATGVGDRNVTLGLSVMPFDHALPEEGSELQSTVVRGQFTPLFDLINAIRW